MSAPKKTIFDFALLKRVFRYAAPYKKKFYISVALAILLAVITPIRPLLIQLTVNKYIANQMAVMLI
ncbi:MAG: ABC transporter ATP-binding protein, partial [Chitinophagaceae bacterium]|nr:ABC transporter ATP-binding protein [Chitinophagaceae bacterium]